MESEERVLVHMATADAAEQVSHLLAKEEIASTCCRDMTELCRDIQRGAAVAVLEEEALAGDRAGRLAEVLDEQPFWSDFPLVVLAGDGDAGGAAFESLNVRLVERPVRERTLVSLVRAALRARRYQYQVRDQLCERKQAQKALEESRQRLATVLDAARMATWDWDLTTDQAYASESATEVLGLVPGKSFSASVQGLKLVHPDDVDHHRDLIRRAARHGESWHTEFRIIRPCDGELAWIEERATAIRDPETGNLRVTGLVWDITKRRRMEEDLREADRKKDEFIALLAHELRNPLAPIRNGLEILQLTDGDVSATALAREMMGRQLAHMVRLIDDLLDVSRISRNKLELRRERVLLADVINSAVETARPAIDGAEHELNISLPQRPVYLNADLTRLAQVFSNLLTNSAKYTERGGRIWISAERQGTDVRVTVRDTGIGIPAESLEDIFDMFSQVERSNERTVGGLGIGLALVKGLVEAHGGRVCATSDGDGKGSVFSVTLPMLAEQIEPGPAERRWRRAAAGLGKRILVVDDNADGAKSLMMMLRLLGNDVEMAHDGVEAVEVAERFRPEVILMDIGMPRLDGYEATRRIRENEWGRRISIIALTGWGQDSDRELSREAGCDDHLVKPVNLPELEQRLQAIGSGGGADVARSGRGERTANVDATSFNPEPTARK
jgi:two-component system CheB/CheR fusion protein